jgi:hypothetical protein
MVTKYANYILEKVSILGTIESILASSLGKGLTRKART